MSKFIVTVRTASGQHAYSAIGTSSASVAAAAYDLFGACGVTVHPLDRSAA